MTELMNGMFWGGLLMAMPPVLLGIGIAALVLRHRRTRPPADREATGP